ncbi:MAG TPA: DUF2877 domain-containing protein [Myxococcales bacterium]|jgi:hypothetical protein
MSATPQPSRRFDRSLLGAGPLRGEIVAVFSHAAVVRTAPGGSLLTLLHPSRDLVPFGVTIPWEQATLSAGDAVLLDERVLSVGGARLLLEGDGTALRLVAAPFSHEALKDHLALAVPFARRDRSALECKALGTADESLRRVVVGLTTGLHAPRDLSAAVQKLVGVGFGSTPTGDDWLVGVAALGHRLAYSGFTFRPTWEAFLDALSQVPDTATTPVACQMLRHASRGDLPEALLRVASLLGDPSARRDALCEACRRLIAVGSQTGGDFLTGALSLASAVRTQRAGIA